MSGQITLTRQGSIGLLLIDHAARRNAISQAMWASLPGLMDRVEAEQEITVVIIHGGEGGAFASGADISEFETIYATPEAAARSSAIIAEGLAAIEQCTKPVIAAIEGICVGGGVSIAMACDLRVATSNSRFAVTPGKLGLCYPVADTRRLIEVAGPSHTADILMTGRLFGADEAQQMGLLNRLCEADALAVARELAEQISATSQWSARASKSQIKRLMGGADDHDPEAASLYLSAFEGEDFQEGFRAFLAKRKPDFKFR